MGKPLENAKLCPFCGGDTIELCGPYWQNIPKEQEYFCQCMDCTSTGPNGMEPESAVLQWNRRSRKARGWGTQCASVDTRSTGGTRICTVTNAIVGAVALTQ